jgi:hypothetical protein
MIQENRSLNQRIRELEARLHTNEPKSVRQQLQSKNERVICARPILKRKFLMICKLVFVVF